jgi:hypothetical protein
MLYDPKDHYEPEETTQDFSKHSKLYERFMRIKQWKLLAPFMKHHADGHEHPAKGGSSKTGGAKGGNSVKASGSEMSASGSKLGAVVKAGSNVVRLKSLFHTFFNF